MRSVTIEAATWPETRARAVEAWDALDTAGATLIGFRKEGSAIVLRYRDAITDDAEGEE